MLEISIINVFSVNRLSQVNASSVCWLHIGNMSGLCSEGPLFK